MNKKIMDYLFVNRSSKQTVMKNTFWLFLADGVNKVTLLILTILLARYLGVAGYGKFSFALSFAALFTIIASFGINTLTVRELARTKSSHNNYLNNLLFLKCVLAIIAIVFIALASTFAGKNFEHQLLIFVLGLYVIFNNFSDFFRAVFKAFEKMQYEALSKVVQSIILLILVLLSFYLRVSINWIAACYVAASVIGLLVTGLLIHTKFSGLRFKFDAIICRRILSESWPFALSSVFFFIYFSIDTVMLSFMRGDVEVGTYSVAYSLIAALYFIPYLMSMPFFPKMSKLFGGVKSKINSLLKHWYSNLILVLVPLFILTFIFADDIILLLYGYNYSKSILVFRILLISLIFKFMSHPPAFSLSAFNQQKKRILVQGVVALFNVVTNLIFIPI